MDEMRWMKMGHIQCQLLPPWELLSSLSFFLRAGPAFSLISRQVSSVCSPASEPSPSPNQPVVTQIAPELVQDVAEPEYSRRSADGARCPHAKWYEPTPCPILGFSCISLLHLRCAHRGLFVVKVLLLYHIVRSS
jgi:hypothetical protein